MKIVQKNVRRAYEKLPIPAKPNPAKLAELSGSRTRVVNRVVVGGHRKSKVLRKPPDPVPPLDLPKPTEMTVGEWFSTKTPVEVSVIVPLYKSSKQIAEQISSWQIDGKLEVIYVDDRCPERSYTEVVRIWETRKAELKNGVGKIVLHDKNCGFAAACNTGASYASGQYLIFLNADCTVTPDWVEPMLELLKSDESIGIVGNLHLKRDKKVDSAGSEWSSNSFQHIGRNIYKGKSLPKPFEYPQLPPDLLIASQRQMVTGACFIIPKKTFDAVGGFDCNYRIGYWEDADLCMKVRSTGLKIYYEPKSIIYHLGGHSKSHGHKFLQHNRNLFYKKWLTGNVLQNFDEPQYYQPNLSDKKTGTIVGCVIACNEEEFLEASVDSLSSIIDKWIFVVGGNEYAYRAGMCQANGLPTDNTLEIARQLATKYGGIVIEPRGLWKDKVEMRNAYAKLLKPGEWMFLQDADEVYTESQLFKVLELMKRHESIWMQYWTFWNNVNTLGTGRWNEFPCERLIKWRSGYLYRGKNHLEVSSPEGRIVSRFVPRAKMDERLFYHYSWVRPIEKIRQKLFYYKHQTGNNNDSYVDNVFLKWRADPESVRGRTHPMGGGDFATFFGKHPPQIQKLIEQNKLNF